MPDTALLTTIGSKKSVSKNLRKLIPNDTKGIIEPFARSMAFSVFSGREVGGILNEVQLGWHCLAIALKYYPLYLYNALIDKRISKEEFDTIKAPKRNEIELDSPRINPKELCYRNADGKYITMKPEDIVTRAAELVYTCHTGHNGMDLEKYSLGNKIDMEEVQNDYKESVCSIFYYSYKLKNFDLFAEPIEAFIPCIKKALKKMQKEQHKKILVFVDPPYFNTLQYSNVKLREETEFRFRLDTDKYKNYEQYEKEGYYKYTRTWAWGSNKQKAEELKRVALQQFNMHCYVADELAKVCKNQYLLICNSHNPATNYLYEKLGFKHIGTTGKRNKFTCYYGNQLLCDALIKRGNWDGKAMDLEKTNNMLNWD